MTPLPWRLVAALSVTQIVHWGSLYYAFSVLMPAMEAGLDIGRVTMTGAFSAALLAQAAASAPAGRAFDRLGTRRCMTAGSLLAGLGLAAAAWVQDVPTLFAAWMVCGVAAAFTQYEAAFAAVTAAFGAQARRGITVLTFAGGLASTVFWPLTAVLEDWLGWRGALLVLAGLNAACAALHAGFLPGPVPRGQALPGTSLAQALRMRAFWLLAASLTLSGFAFAAIAAHVVPAMTEKGLGATALILVPFIGVAQTAGRIIEFSLGGRIKLAAVGIGALAAYPISFLLLAWTTDIIPLVLFVLLYGVSNGLQTIVRGALPAEMFGRAAYGAISGALAAPAALAKAAGPVSLGLMWAVSGGYAWPLTALAMLGLLACLLFIAAMRAARAA